MIVIYTSPGCASCRKVKTYLKENNLKFKEKNIFKILLKEKEIKYLLSRSENGTDDIISPRSKLVLDGKYDFDSMSLSQLIKFIINNPSILRRPIIIDENNMQVGYDNEEIEIFNRLRNIAKCDKSCSHYNSCGKFRE